VTDSGWAATRPDTGVLMLAASGGPDLDDVLTVLVRRLFGLTQLDQAVPLVASLAEVQMAAGADAEAV
jgi:hypothetical protein